MSQIIEVDGKKVRYTDKMILFVEFYLQHFNATKAALNAGYSEKTAFAIGHENLNKPKIQDLIKKRMSDVVMDTDEVLFRLGKMARATLADVVDIDEKGVVKLDLKKAKDNGAIHIIRSLVPTAHGLKVELHDQRGALVDIGKYLQMFTQKVDITSLGKELKGYTIVSPDDWDK